jgi:hypothetical protein
MAATLQSCIQDAFCATWGGTPTDSTANDGALGAYLLANGPQTYTATN